MSGATAAPAVVPAEVLLEDAARERDAYRELLILALGKLHDAERRREQLDAELFDLRARLRGAIQRCERVA